MTRDDEKLAKALYDCIKALQEIDRICSRSHRFGIDMEDVKEIEAQVDKGLGRERKIKY